MIQREVSAALHEHLAGRGPGTVVLLGAPRTGKTALLQDMARQVRTRRPVFWIRGSGLPGALAAREAARSLTYQDASAEGRPEPDGDDPPWILLERALRRMVRSERPPVLVIDQADGLLQDRRIADLIRDWWQELRAQARPVHLVIALRSEAALDALRNPAGADRPQSPPVVVRIPELSLREARQAVGSWRPGDVVELFALVGGTPDFWSMVNDRWSARTNLNRLLLEPGAPLRHLPGLVLGASGIQRDRELAILTAMGRGAATWGEIRTGAEVFRTSSELGPYMKRLEDARIVDPSRSLDAAPGSRGTRYRVTRPILESWSGLFRPRLSRLDRGDPPDVLWDGEMQQGLDALLVRRIPEIVGEVLERYGHRRLPGLARERGGLWGEGYDIPVAGTLTTGSVFFGLAPWREAGPAILDRIIHAARATSYGFSREGRFHLLVLREGPEHPLARAVARSDGAVVVSAADLLGEYEG